MLTLSHKYTHITTHTHTQIRTHTNMYTHILLAYPVIIVERCTTLEALTHTHIRTHTHTHTHTHTNTYTHTPSLLTLSYLLSAAPRLKRSGKSGLAIHSLCIQREKKEIGSNRTATYNFIFYHTPMYTKGEEENWVEQDGHIYIFITHITYISIVHVSM